MSFYTLVSICRGFGFVTFADVTGVDKVLAQNSHDLDGKKVGVFHSQQLFHANHHERVHSVSQNLGKLHILAVNV